MKTLKKLKTFIYMLVFVLILFLKNLYLFNDLYTPGEIAMTLNNALLTIDALLIFGVMLLSMKRKNRYIFTLIFDFILSSILFVNHVYYRYFNDFMSFRIFSEIGQTGDVLGSIYGLIKVKDIIYFWDIGILLVVFLIYLIFNIFRGLFRKLFKKDLKNENDINPLLKTRKDLSKIRMKKNEDIKKFDWYLIKLKATIVIIFLFIVAIFFSQNALDNFDKRNANRIAASQVGMYYYNLYDFVEVIHDKFTQPKLSDSEKNEMKEYFSNISRNIKNDYTGIARGKNVIFIQEESLSNYVINLKYNGQEITPNINKLIKNSYYNNNFYNQVGGGHSSDCERLILNGLYPLDDKSINLVYGNNDYSSLVQQFNDNGYNTISAHGYRGDFWNRINVYKKIGFKTSYFEDSYVSEDKSGWGISDEDFFTQTIDKIKDTDKPFMSYLITLEDHTPFNIAADKEELQLDKDLESSSMGKYLQMTHKVDKSIGVLIDKLKKEGLYDNTMIVIYGDHDAEFNKKDVSKIKEFDNDAIAETEIKKVPLIIHIPNVDTMNSTVNIEEDKTQNSITNVYPKFNKIDNTLASEIDVSKTVLNLLGMEDNMKISFGKDIFNRDKDKKVLMQGGTFVSNRYVITSDLQGNLKVYDLKQQDYIDVTDDIKNEYNNTEKTKEYSNLISKLNLVKELEQ